MADLVTNILSINFNHDGSGVILADGQIAAFVNTERYSRRKKHPGLRDADLTELLSQAGIALGQIDVVLLCNLNTMDSVEIIAEHGSDLRSTWLDFKVYKGRRCVRIRDLDLPCVVNPDHHMLHAALAFFTSPFQSAMVFSEDPTGFAAFIGKGLDLVPVLDELPDFRAPNLYTDVAIELFGSALFGAGKVMGLAPYGAPDNGMEPPVPSVVGYRELKSAADADPCIVSDGVHRWNARLAFLVQDVLNRQLARVLGCLCELGDREGLPRNLCLGGGTALNSVSNQVAFERSGFEAIHMHPACGDDGTAIGAALWYWHTQLRNPRQVFDNRQLMYSVRTYEDQVDDAIKAHCEALRVERTANYVEAAARLLEQGHVLGWYQGASEIGPRALGHRSLLADPRRPDVRDILNLRVKSREAFRPFAPAVLADQAELWFGLNESPFMLRVARVLRGGVPAVTHADGTARVQTVASADSPHFYALLECFFHLTGIPMLLNTSLNAAGEPIVESPHDAIACFLSSGIDNLVLEETILHRVAV